MAKGVANEYQVHWLKGYIDAKIESFAVATDGSVSILSQRMGELLYPMGHRMQDRVPQLRGSASEAVEVQRGAVEMGRPASYSGASSVQPEGGERDPESQPGKTRKKWVMTPEQRQLISERRKRWWAKQTPEQKKKLTKKIQRAKQAKSGKPLGRPKGSKNKPKEVINDTTGS